jgi:hypothetical protein
MPGNPLVRFDEGRVGRTSVSPSLLLYRLGEKLMKADLDENAIAKEIVDAAFRIIDPGGL